MLITLLLALALFAALWARGVMDDKADERDRHAARGGPAGRHGQEGAHEDFAHHRTRRARRGPFDEGAPAVAADAVRVRGLRAARHARQTVRGDGVARFRHGDAQRKHKILQIFHLPDGNYTRAERVTVLAVLIFATLAANALFLSVAPPFTIGGTEASIHNALRDTTHVAKKCFGHPFAAMFSTFLYLGFAFLFSKTGEK